METIKTCCKCGEDKHLDEFNRQASNADSRRYDCRACSNAASRAWNEANIKRKAATSRKWHKANRDMSLANSRRWRKANPDRLAELNSRWHGVDPNRKRAHNAVNNSVAAGQMERATHCEQCGSDGRIDAHHDSYEPGRWLDVRWLCTFCHCQYHAAQRAEMTAIEESTGIFLEEG